MIVALLAAACAPGSPRATAQPSPLASTPDGNRNLEAAETGTTIEASPSPTHSSSEQMQTPTRRVEWGQPTSIELDEGVDMAPGDVVAIAGTGVEIMLVEAQGPGPGCHDCPNSALLVVRSNGETQELKYTFSGNMLRELLIKARQKEAFGYVLIAERIDDDSFTLRVEPHSSLE